MRNRVKAPCSKKCGRMVERDESLVKRGVQVICEPCRVSRNTEYARLQREAMRQLIARYVPESVLKKMSKSRKWRYAGILDHIKKKS